MSDTLSTFKKDLDQEALRNFRSYLQIPSVHPNVDYDPCLEFLENQAKNLNLPIKVSTIVPKKPILVLSWIGTEPSLPSILLNSHMDVVPVFEEQWTYKPFSAHVVNQKIYARGTQDMKSVGIQYLEAVRRLKMRKIKLKRTLHISFVPDEEIGGLDGMKKFVLTDDFQKLNVGVALDEGVASPSDDFIAFNGERCAWNFHIHCPGNPGHGSLLLDNSPGEKVAYILDKLYNFRRQEKQKLIENPSWTLGDVTTVNLTQIRGGVLTNVIPSEFIISFDCRIPPERVNLVDFEETIKQWCKEAGSDVWIENSFQESEVASTKLDSNIYWKAFKEAADKHGLKLKTQIFPGSTDIRFIRELGLPAFGFSPINNTPVLLHNHDEYLGVDTFLRGIEIYCDILTSIGNA